jgi:hypothetical protein
VGASSTPDHPDYAESLATRWALIDVGFRLMTLVSTPRDHLLQYEYVVTSRRYS